MDGLRLSLILLGVLVVAGVILWDRYRRRKQGRADQWADLPDPADRLDGGRHQDDEAMLDDWEVIPLSASRTSEDLDDLDEKIVASRDAVEVEPTPQKDNEPAAQKERVIVLSVMAGEGKQFGGTAIAAAASSLGMIFGEHDIYHAYPVNADEPLFSLANVLEPGSFDNMNLENLSTPGLALFMRLPGPQSGEQALGSMLSTATQLAEQLGGELCDERRRPLTSEKREVLQRQAAGYPPSN